MKKCYTAAFVILGFILLLAISCQEKKAMDVTVLLFLIITACWLMPRFNERCSWRAIRLWVAYR